jgi:hypothetical protein
VNAQVTMLAMEKSMSLSLTKFAALMPMSSAIWAIGPKSWL